MTLIIKLDNRNIFDTLSYIPGNHYRKSSSITGTATDGG